MTSVAGRPAPRARSSTSRSRAVGAQRPCKLPLRGKPGEPDGDSAPARGRSPAPDSAPGGRARRGGRARVARGGASPGRKERADPGSLGGNMPNFLLALQTQSGAAEARARVRERDLRQWGLTGQWPRAEVSRGPSAMRTVLGAAAPPEDRPGSAVPAVLAACPPRHCGGAERRGARLAPGGHCPPPAQRAALADAGRVALRAPGMWPGGGGDGETLSKETSFSDEAEETWCLKGVGLQT